MSDAVSLKTSGDEDLTILVSYPKPIPREVTWAIQGAKGERNSLTPGNAVSDTALACHGQRLQATHLLNGVDVEGEFVDAFVVAQPPHQRTAAPSVNSRNPPLGSAL